MPSLTDTDHSEVRAWLSAAEQGAFVEKSGGPASGGYTGGYSGGSAFTDAFRTRRAPTGFDLVEQFKSVAFACANLKANGVARVPLKLYATTARGQARPKSYTRKLTTRQRTRIKSSQWLSSVVAKSEEIDEVMEHPALDSISQPNPEFDLSAFVRFISISLDIIGSSYSWPERSGAAKWLIWPLQAQYVYPIRSASQATVDSYTYLGTNYLPDELIRIRNTSLRDPYGNGYAPLQAAFEFAGLGDKLVSVQENMLGSGFRPSVALSLKDGTNPMGPAERARAEIDFNTKWNGARAGKAFLVDGALDVNPLTFPPSDLGSLEIQASVEKVVAYCFGVPLSMLKTEDVNLANAEAGHRQLASLAVEPRCVDIASGLTRWLHAAAIQSRTNDAKSNNWERLFFAFDDPVGEDQERQAKVFDIQLKNGSKVINQVREYYNDDPVDWGDEPWLAQTLIQPSAAAENRANAQALAEQAAKQPEAKPGDTAKPEPSDTETEKAVLESIAAILKGLESHAKIDAPDAGHRHDHTHEDVAPLLPRQRARKHVWLADGGEDQAGAAEVVPDAAGARPGDADDDRGSDPGIVPESDEL